MDLTKITVIIVTYKSELVLDNCLRSIPSQVEIIIIDNSDNNEMKLKIEKKYSNVRYILSGENIGYSKANNIGLAQTKTEFALVLNPDTVLKKNALENFSKLAKKYNNFWLMGPLKQQSKILENNKMEIVEVNDLKGFAIFFNLKKFDGNYFDENFFLYFEEIDICKKVKKNGGHIFVSPLIEIEHKEASSVYLKEKQEIEKNRNWHWMWSTFYFQKKHNGFFYAFIAIQPKLISALFKTIFYFIVFNKKQRDIYFCRLSGLFNSMIGKKSWYRPPIN